METNEIWYKENKDGFTLVKIIGIVENEFKPDLLGVIYSDAKKNYVLESDDFKLVYKFLMKSEDMAKIIRLYNDRDFITNEKPREILDTLYNQFKNRSENNEWDMNFGNLISLSAENLRKTLFDPKDSDANEFVSYKELRCMDGGRAVIGLLEMAGDTIYINDKDLKMIKQNYKDAGNKEKYLNG